MIQVGWFTSASRMLALATVFAAGPAMAHMQAATSCRMAELAVKGLQYSGAGIGALHTRTEVICPVDRLTDIPAGGSFMTYVYAEAGTGSIQCSLESYNEYGHFLGSQGFDLTSTISYQLVLTATQVPPRSSQVLHCVMTQGTHLWNYEAFERSN